MKQDNAINQLFKIAQVQGGYFTSFQAKKAGFKDSIHGYHVQKGNWIREWRGVYRLARYPLQDDWQYSQWGIWSMNRLEQIIGIYSHETALSIYGLSDIMPTKLHMTVPRGYRRHSKLPEVLRLHFSDINPLDCEVYTGYRVTKPVRTIIDVVRSLSVSLELIHQAVTESLEKGSLTRLQYRTIKKMPRVGPRLCEIMGEKN
jgi:predicted transcriptional regulator of viral defense system